MVSKITSLCKRISFLFYCIAILAVFETTSAQAPGGVSGNLKLWLKANSSVTPATQGVAITAWNDLSGGANHAIIPSLTPIVVNPTYQQNTLNFNPSVRFTGTSNLSFSALGGVLTPAVTSNNVSVYTVFLMNSATNTPGRVFVISQNALTSDWQNTAGANFINRNGAGTGIIGYRNGNGGPAVGPVIGAPVIASTHFTTTNQWKTEINGNAFTSAAFPTTAFNASYFRLGQSTFSNDDYFNGDIAEVILYTADQSSLSSHNQIESYLAVKYGIHKTGSYVNSSGSNIWDATANAAYHNDVFGIGQDNASGLLQTQSNSTSTGSGDGTGQSGKGNITISSPSSLTNNAFLMIGHNTGALTEADIIDAGNPTKRIARIWKVQRTGNPGTITLNYDRAGLTYSGTVASDYTLLVDPTGAGNFSGASVITYKAAALNGTKVTFNNIDLPNGAVFTFQTMLSPIIPVTQAVNVNFTNTTGTSTTVNWTNGTASLRAVFMHLGTSGSPVPADYTIYTANAAFGLGTQIGTTGWFCIYNGTGTSVNVTGLTAATTYQVMAVEYNGSLPGNQSYQTVISTGNPAGVTTLNNVASLSDLTISAGTLDPVFAPGTTSYTAIVDYFTTSLTVTPVATDANATIKVNGVIVPSGNASGTIALVVGPNIITKIVTAQDGTTTQTYTLTITRAAAPPPPPIITSFSPQSGSVGTTVTITGSNFSGTLSENIVFFGATQATVTAATTTSLTVTVPAGASYQAISVVNGATALVGYSATPFITTFAPNKGNITIDDLEPKVNFSVSANANAIAIGDFDGDGKSDLAVVNGNVVSVFLNTASSGVISSGSFASKIDFPVGSTPRGVVVGDFDGDGKLDIAVGNYSSHTISILRNTSSGIGNIAFAGQVSYGTGTNPYVITAGDFDKDGKADLAVANFSSGTVSVFRNISSGPGEINFATKLDYATGANPYGIASGDLDGDGAIDLVTGNYNGNSISVLRNTSTVGTISFAGQVAFPNGRRINTLVIGDLNKDGKADIAASNNGNSFITVFTNTSSGAGNINFASKIDFPLTTNSNGIAIGDLDGDGNLDLAVNTAGTTLAVFRNTSSAGGTISLANPVYFTNDGNTGGTAIGDLDGDGKDDLVSFNYGNNNISVFRNNPLFGPTVQAVDVTFTGTTGTTTTANWTNGNGSSRTVFMYAGTSGSPVPVNYTAYTANAVFGTGTQIGSTGWYCIYNGTGTTVNITGLTPATTYQLMVVERNGSPTDELYLPTVSTGNPAGVTTLSNVATLSNLTISEGTLNPVFATATTSYTATVANAFTSLTLTPTVTDANATVKVNGVAVTSGSPSGAIALAVGPNIITTIVTAQDGITLGTYTVTVNRTAPPTITTSGTLSALTTTYGTASASTTFKVSGTNMLEGVIVSPPPGFEVSSDNINFSVAIGIGGSATITDIPVYIRLKETDAAGNYSGDIVLTSNSATTITLPTVLSVVNKAPLTITADNKTKIYGSANPALTVTYSGFVNGDTVASLTTLPTITTAADETSPVGSYLIIPSAAVATNYDFTYVNGNLEVTKAMLTVTADNQTKAYGSANPTLTATYTGFANSETVSILTTPATITTAADETSPVGSYLIIPSAAVATNYDFTYVNGNLEVTKAMLTVTADNQTKAYGAANPTLTATYTGFANSETVASLTTPATITTIADETSPVGTYLIIPSAAVATNYDFTYVNGNLEVTKAMLTVTADNQTKAYGAANPTLTATYTGFANSETVAILTTPATITTTADETSPVGTYLIIPSAAAATNYDFTYVNGNLEVTKAMLTVTADNQTKAYGTANPTLTATYTGFANSETVASLTTPATITTIADETSPVGTYLIIPSAAVDTNYDFTYVNGNLEVTKAMLTVTADNQTKAYGAANPTLTATYTGFANSETVAILTTPATITTTADETSPVGTYLIIPSAAAATNYDFTYVNGNLEVTKAMLTVTADNQTKAYGTANPTLTATYTGFANSETVAILTTPATITTTADETSPVGTYLIIPSGAVATNYDFTYVNGNLEVTKAMLTVTADNQTKAYGSANPTLTATYTGFANSETVASLTTPATITTIADETSSVGSYTIIPSAAVATNYDFTYVNGNLEVTKAMLTVTAENKTKVYGNANPTLTVTYSAFANGDTVASLATPPTITTAADETSPVGTYLIIPSGAASTNYDFTYVNGNLEVTVATITVTADNKTKDYGDVNPTLTATYTGFVNGDNETSLTTLATVTTTADTSSPAGTYPITAIGALSTNYTFTYVPGTLTVMALTDASLANLTISEGSLTPVFNTGTTSYTSTVSNAITSLTVTPVTTDAGATVTVNGVAVISGNASGTIALTVGSNTITTIVTAQDGTTTETYTIVVNRTAAPTIVTTGILAALTTTYGTPSTSTTFNISGSDMLEGILVTPPSGFEVSSDNSTFSNTITVGAAGTIANIPVYIRLKETIAAGSYAGDVVLTSDNAITVNVPTISSTVNKASLTVTAGDESRAYGDINPGFTATYSGFVNGDTSASLTTLATVITTADTNSAAGTYPITASGAVSTNYSFTYVPGTLTITPVALTITAENHTKIYGSANPTLTVTYNGFVNGDNSTSLTTQPIITTIADATSPVGIYPILVSGAVNSNYTINYVPGALAVIPANLAIAADNKTKIYGEANPSFTFTYTGFVNGDNEADLTSLPLGSTTADASSPVGIYPITISGAASNNYTIGYTAGATLAITPANLAIAADDKTKIYGEANPSFTFTYTGFVNGDNETDLTSLPLGSTTADSSSPVGIYPITISGAASNNYTIGYTAGATLAITPANLAIAADNKTKIYGEVNPQFTFTYTGFVNGDNETDLTSLPLGSTTADASSPVGIYPITISGAASNNYTIGYTAGATLAITPANLAIAADNKTKIYGEVNPQFTFTYTGFVNGDNETDLTSLPLGSTTADASNPVGIYPITISGAASNNYTIGYTAGATLTITPAGLTITAEDKTKVYGSANPALTVSYSGFVNGDTEASLTAQPTISTTAVTGSSIGPYPITASGALNPNYIISYIDGSLTVTTATLTITADNKTKVYGSANPTLTASYTGFVNGDTAASLTTQPTIATTAVAGSSIGTYPITASGALNPNYIINYMDGSLNVTGAALTITVDNKTKVYGSANPALTATYSGFVNGDTAASLTTQPTISTTAVAGSSIGTYPITASGALNPNYVINYIDGSLTVTTATLTITADNKTKVYGSANPALTVSYAGFVNGDTAASLTTQPTISTTAVAGSNAGTYPITVSGATSSNYIINYSNGNLTVNTAPLTITADDKTRVYGAPNPTLTASYSGFVNGDTVASLTTPPTISTIANATSPVGLYAITVNGAIDPNYNISYVTGTLTVITAEDVNLTSLTINNGVLSPPFSPNVLLYNVIVDSNINTETITVVADDPLAKITINGITILSGGSLTPVSLLRGVNTFTIKVTSEDGSSTKTYVLNINKEGSDNASLSNLTISEGTLNPAFASNVVDYNAVVKYDVNSIRVTPTATDPEAKITVNGIAVASGAASAPVNLSAGENIIEVVVTAADGITKEIYAITVYKGVSPDQLVVTNVMSPNGDGKNDFWVIEDIELFPNNKVTVYDRAGRIVYSKNSYSNEWDGSYSGSPLNNDTYYYLIDLGDSLPKIKGFITMIRD